MIMSELQMQAIEIIEGLPEENLEALVNFMRLFVLSKGSSDHVQAGQVRSNSARIGAASGKTLIAPDYDIDEYNGEIAKMFGVTA